MTVYPVKYPLYALVTLTLNDIDAPAQHFSALEDVVAFGPGGAPMMSDGAGGLVAVREKYQAASVQGSLSVGLFHSLERAKDAQEVFHSKDPGSMNREMGTSHMERGKWAARLVRTRYKWCELRVVPSPWNGWDVVLRLDGSYADKAQADEVMDAFMATHILPAQKLTSDN